MKSSGSVQLLKPGLNSLHGFNSAKALSLVELQPCISSKGWDWMVLRVPSNPIHSGILNALTKRFGIRRVGLGFFLKKRVTEFIMVQVRQVRGGSEQVAGQLWLCNLGTMCLLGQILCRLQFCFCACLNSLIHIV